jgi:hypothetical protein
MLYSRFRTFLGKTMKKIIRKRDLDTAGSDRKGSVEASKEMLADMNNKQKKRGRPSLTERRDALMAILGPDKMRSMDGEAKRPIEQLKQKEFEELYANVAREKGWPQCF